MRREPCILRDPQRRETKSEVAASPLPSRGPKRGRKCNVTLAFWGVPNAKHREQNQKWLPHPCLVGGPKEGGNAMSPLHSWGSPTKGNNVGSGCLTHAFSGAQRRRKGCVTLALSGGSQQTGAKLEVVPNKREQNQKWLPHPCLLRGPKESGSDAAPLHSLGSPTPSAGSKIRSGTQQRGTKSEVAASPLPSRVPKRGRKCYFTPVFSGVRNAKRGEKVRSGHSALLGYTRTDTPKTYCLFSFFSYLFVTLA